MDRDHIRCVAKLRDTRIAGKADVAPSNGTTTEAKTEDRQAAFEAKEAFLERNASGLGFGEDQACEVEGFLGDHGASCTGNPPEAVDQLPFELPTIRVSSWNTEPYARRMGDQTVLEAVLLQVPGERLDNIIRSDSGEVPPRLKPEKVKLLARLILSGAVDFDAVVGSPFLRVSELEDMCAEAGLDHDGFKKDMVRRLSAWFAREFEAEVGAALSEGSRGTDADDDSDHGPASVESVLDDYECEAGATIAEDEPEDREYQAQALEELQQAFDQHERVVLSLPTGAGKTFVAAKWLADNLRGGRALWLTHRAELVKQAEDELRRVFGHDRSITRWTSSEKDGTGVVVIATVGCQTVPEGPFEVLVVDEAHHRAAPTYKAWASKYRGYRELGLTATPERLDRRKLNYDGIVKRSFWELVELHYLAAPIQHVVKTNELYDLRKDSIRDDFDEGSLKQLDNPKRNRVIIDQFLKHQAEYGKTLVFAINVAHADSLVAAFAKTAPHVRVASILGTTDKAQRAKLVEEFQAGRIDVLINCKVFVEGFNCKDIQTIFLTRPTMSAVLYCQMVGRGTRVVGSKKTFHLVEFEDQLAKYTDKLAGFWCLGTRDATVIREATERAKKRPADPPALLSPNESIQWSSELHSIGGVLAYWHAAGALQGATLVYKPEVAAVAGAVGANGASDATALEAAIMRGHWTDQEKQLLASLPRSGFLFHFYDFHRTDIAPPPTAPAAVVAIHTTAKEVAPLSEVEAFLGQPEEIDWGGDAAEWRREFLSEQRQVSAVLRVVDDYTGKVMPQKVFEVEDAKIRAAISDIENARDLTTGEKRFALKKRVYANRLSGTSITEYKWLCIAEAVLRGNPTLLDLKASRSLAGTKSEGRSAVNPTL